MKLKEIDLKKLKKLKEGDTFNDIKDVKEINTEIKDLDIYKEPIGKNCLKYLKDDVVRTKEFSLNIMLTKCKTAKEARKKKARKQRVGRAKGSNQDARLLSKKTKEELDKEAQDKKDGKEKPPSTIVKNSGKILKALLEANGDPVKTIDILAKDKIFIKDTMEGLLSTLQAVIAYYIKDEELASNIFYLSSTLLTTLSALMGYESVKFLAKKLKALMKYLYKKGKKFKRFLGFGGGGNNDDDDDDDDDNNDRRDFTINLNPEIREVITDIQNQSEPSQANGGDRDREPPPQPPPSGSSAVLQFLEQQQRSNINSQLKTARLETDSLLRQTQETTSREPEIEKDKSVKIGDNEYFKYDNVEKFKKRYEEDMADLRKEDKYKSFSDDDFFSKYTNTLTEKSNVFKPNNIHHQDNVPIRKQKAVILRPEKTGVGFLAPMDNNIDTGIGHTTPDTYWKTLQDYGEKVQRSVPLAMTGMGLAGLAGASYYLGKTNVVKDPQEQNRIKELELRDKGLSDIGMNQIRDIIKLKTENERLEGRERFLSGQIANNMGYGMLDTDDLIKSSSAGASSAQLNPISHDQIVERQRAERIRNEGQSLTTLERISREGERLGILGGED